MDSHWKKADHNVLIVAVTLNPFAKLTHFTPMISTEMLVTMIERLYCHVFEVDVPPETLGPHSIAYLMDPHDAFSYTDGDWSQNNLHKQILVRAQYTLKCFAHAFSFRTPTHSKHGNVCAPLSENPLF